MKKQFNLFLNYIRELHTVTRKKKGKIECLNGFALNASKKSSRSGKKQ
jgi:hypothetical protein